MAAQKTGSIKALLAEIKAGTRGRRTEEEERTVREAAAYLAALEAAKLARLDTLLEDISRLPANEDPRRLRSKVEQLLQVAAEAGKLGEHRQISSSCGVRAFGVCPFRPGWPSRSSRKNVCRCTSRSAARTGPRGRAPSAGLTAASSAWSTGDRMPAAYGNYRTSTGCGPSSPNSRNSRRSTRRSGPCGWRTTCPAPLRSGGRRLVPHTRRTPLRALQAGQEAHRAARALPLSLTFLVRPRTGLELVRGLPCSWRVRRAGG